MPFAPILCAPLPVPLWAGGLAVGAAAVFVTAAGAAYYLSMRHVLLLRLLYYGTAALAVTLAARSALGMAGSPAACADALSSLALVLTRWSEAVGTGRLSLCGSGSSRGTSVACSVAAVFGVAPEAVRHGLLFASAIAIALLCRAALTRRAPPGTFSAAAALFAIAALAVGVEVAAPTAPHPGEAAPASVSDTVLALASAAAGAFGRHAVGAALSELSWLHLVVRGATAVVARSALTGALSRPAAAAAVQLISSAGWLCAAVLLVRRYTRLVAQVAVRGFRTAFAAASEKSAAVLCVQVLCGAPLHSPLMLPVFWALDADSAHAVLWRDCTTSTSGEFLGVAAPHVLGVAAPNVLASWGLWDERVVADVAESDAESEDSAGGGGGAVAGGVVAGVPEGDAVAPKPAKRLAPAQQLRLCAGLGCPLLWVRARWVASAAAVALAAVATLALLKEGAVVGGVWRRDNAGIGVDAPSHCFVKADPVACVALALSGGLDSAAAAAASRCFMPAAGLVRASLVQSGASMLVDAASAVFVAVAVAAAALSGLASLLNGAGSWTQRSGALLVPHHGARAHHAHGPMSAAARGSLALHEAHLLSVLSPLPLLQAALLCTGALLALFRRQSRGLLAGAGCSRSAAGPAAATATTAADTPRADDGESTPRRGSTSAVVEAPTAPALVAAWCWVLRGAALAAMVLVGAVTLRAAVPRATLARWVSAVLPLPVDLADIQIASAAALLTAVGIAELLPPRHAPAALAAAGLHSAAGFARATAGACLLALCVAIAPYALVVSDTASVQLGQCGGGTGGASNACAVVRSLTLCLVSRSASEQQLPDSLRAAQAVFLVAALWGWLWQGFLTDHALAGGWWPRWRRRRLARSKAGAIVSLTRKAISVGPRRKRRSPLRPQQDGGEGGEAAGGAGGGSGAASARTVPSAGLTRSAPASSPGGGAGSPRSRTYSAPPSWQWGAGGAEGGAAGGELPPPAAAPVQEAAALRSAAPGRPRSTAGAGAALVPARGAGGGSRGSLVALQPAPAPLMVFVRADGGGSGREARLTRALAHFHRSRRCRSATAAVGAGW